MRMSHQFGQTLRKAPAVAESPGHGLLLRAGYVRPLAPGLLSYLPLGLRSLRKIEAILREELEGIGGQELVMPLIQPARLGQRSGLPHGTGAETARFSDRSGKELLIGGSHEEVAAELARSEVTSYRQLPALFYQIRPVFRDESRPRAGLQRAREFDLFDAYSFDRDRAGLERQYESHKAAFQRVFERLGLGDIVIAHSEFGAEWEDEFLFLTETGDDAAALCEGCGYTAAQRTARFKKPEPVVEPPAALEKVATPGTDTIESLAAFLGIPRERTAKVVFFAEPGREVVVMALVRGDMEVSEKKLARAIGTSTLRPAEAAAIRAVGAEPGYASPVGLDAADLVVVVDDLVASSANLVSGANQTGFHLRNVNYERDYRADQVTDIAAVFPGAPCPECGAPLRLAPCLEVASLHAFGTTLAEPLGLTYQEQDGRVRPPFTGSYGIGVGRLLAVLAETHYDERGLRLPVVVAPYAVHLVALAGGEAAIVAQADELYARLREADIEVLYDDREASGGVKFNDADLIGCPIRLTLGQRSLEAGGVELKRRHRDEKSIVGLEDVVETVKVTLSAPANP